MKIAICDDASQYSGVKDVDRNLSESLGHHRVSVTQIYTAEKKHK